MEPPAQDALAADVSKQPPPRFIASSQRIGWLLLLAAFCGYAGVLATAHRRYVPDPRPPDAPRACELADRLDPNTADAALLAAIPQLGRKRAAAIVAYREQAFRDGRMAFNSIDDLLAVRGIGTSMKEDIRPYLIFPHAAPQP